jgi:methylated-DNA-[protein]-cysteine S-methyltransferase
MISMTEHASPVGPLLLAASDAGLHAIYFAEHRHTDPARRASWRRDDAHPLLRRACAQLDDYFAGARTAFDLPLAPLGTPFQQQVWLGLRDIAYGATSTYGQLAAAIGRQAAVRAVGAANGRNPLSIVVPCHRVIGGSGQLVGYAGGIERKRFLLALEAGKKGNE